MADKIQGIFSVEKISKIGTGSTEKKVKQKMYCQAIEAEDGQIDVRYLGKDDKPIDVPELVPKDVFIRDYVFQLDYLEKRKAEKENKANKNIVTAEEHVKKNELHSAEYEFKMALKVDEENLRANFGIGNVYLKMGEKDKAKDIFVKISKTDAIFEEKNKHFFNDCAIQLRKQELYTEAIDYYNKAIGLCDEDENLLFNLSRAYAESNDIGEAKGKILKALEINPKFKEAKSYLDYINNQEAAGKSGSETSDEKPAEE
jgi:tetratricopeptide (TPR) repeat protein